MDMRTVYSICFVNCFLIILAGCTTAVTAPIPDATGAADRTLRAEAKPIDGATLNPLAARSGRIEYVEGKLKGKVVLVTLEREGDGWKETTQGVHAMVMHEDAGALVMTREEDVEENVAITYDPPFVLLPREVAMGKKVEGMTTMTVKNLKTGSKRDSGPCQYTVELLGTQTIETPGGTFEAYVFKTVRQIDLSLAKVTVTIHTAHVPYKGIVMTRVERHTKAVGIFSMNAVEESRLAR
jgi:hypothetical protein